MLRCTPLGWLLAALVTSGTLGACNVARSEEPVGHALDLSRFRMTFDEEFRTLSVSPHGPGTTWTAHTPWNGDFGDAEFADPGPNSPFSLRENRLCIEASKDAAGKWHSGLLASADSHGLGFSQQYGYFEMRARLPKGPGLWPAFWLASVADPAAPAGVEIDAMEHYGHFPADFHSGMIVWFVAGEHKGQEHVNPVPRDSLYDRFNTYGVLVEPDWIRFYFNRHEYWRLKTPIEHKRPLLILLDLALGSGWPIDQTPNPSDMLVDYVRVYAKREPGGYKPVGNDPK